MLSAATGGSQSWCHLQAMRAPNWRPITATCMPAALRCTPARPPTRKLPRPTPLRLCSVSLTRQRPARPRSTPKSSTARLRTASNRSARGVAAPQGADDHPPATDRRRHAAKRTSNRGRKTANTKPSPAKLTEHELETALVAAKTADDVCAAVTRAVYAEQHDGVKCPDKRVPKWTEMVQWWHRDGPQSLASEARKALCVVLDENAQWLPWPLGTDSPSDVRATSPIETVSTSVTIPFLDVTEVHRRWLALQPRPSHPLVPFLICFWQFASVETKQDQHDFAIIPHPLRNAERSAGYRGRGSVVHVRPADHPEGSYWPRCGPRRAIHGSAWNHRPLGG